MVTIEGTKITMTRGDTLSTTVTMRLNEEEYVPQAGDKVRFAMKHPTMTSDKGAYTDAEPLLVKDIPTDTMILKLDPEDTKPFPFASYVYDIQITYANGDVDTFISGTIIFKPEVD